RRVAFSSGNSIYFADRKLSKQLNEPFKTQPDTACRYGSLLVSSCNEGAIAFHSSDGQPLRVKIVDWESDDPAEREEARKFSTGDCHGKISPRLAKAMGGRGNGPFQFRFAWMQKLFADIWYLKQKYQQ
ncbi:hypothetical protein, partial [Spirulina sp. 06S082]|uniref:hypothetical protein n=1 Tax=Spirulina sp. 06S082 TaxID=3110248 RepID=UPI002B21C907